MAILLAHPGGPSVPGLRLWVQGERRGGRLTLAFEMEGPVDRIAWPVGEAGVRRDGLWRATCFELFLAGPEGGYVEVNLSPGGDWAAYRFDACRQGMREEPMTAPVIDLYREVWTARLGVKLAGPVAASGQSIGLTAVIEDVDGALSYWALRHPGERPDFHHSDGWLPIEQVLT